MKKGIFIAQIAVLIVAVATLTMVCHRIVISIIDYVLSL